jgi:hypothetical protein
MALYFILTCLFLHPYIQSLILFSQPQDVDGIRELYHHVPAPPPSTGSAAGRVEVDLRATFPWLAQSLICPAINGALVLAFLAAAPAGWGSLLRLVMAGIFTFNAAVYGAGAAWSLWCGRIRDAAVSAVTVATPSFMAWVFWRRERYAIIVVFVPFLQSLALALVRQAAFHSVARLLIPGGDAAGASAARGGAVYYQCWYIAGGVFLWLRRRDVRRARELLDPDRARYDAVWAAECSRPGAAVALAGIATATAALVARAAAAGPPLQLNRRRHAALHSGIAGSGADTPSSITVVPLPAPLHALPTGPGGGERGRNGVRRGWMGTGSFQGIGDCGAGLPGTLDPGRPVDNVDQLFAAAAAAHPFLLERAQAWAAKCGGRFPSGVGRKARGAGARGAGLKSVERALEKIVRVYQQVGGWGVGVGEGIGGQSNGETGRVQIPCFAMHPAGS